MIQYLKDLPVGTTILYLNHEPQKYVFTGDVRPQAFPAGTEPIIWMVAAHNHFLSGSTTLWAYRPLGVVKFGVAQYGREWEGTDLQKRCDELYNSFPIEFKNKILPFSMGMGTHSVNTHVGIFSANELDSTTNTSRIPGGSQGNFLTDSLVKTLFYECRMYYWTRSRDTNSGAYAMGLNGKTLTENKDALLGFRPFINLGGDAVVTYDTMFGHHIMYENTPEPFGYVKLNGAWKPLFGTDVIEGGN